MRSRIKTIITNKEKLFSQRREVLLLGRCRQFLPVSIIERESGYLMYHKTDGMIKLSGIRNLSAEKTLGLLKMVLTAMEKAEEYLFFTCEYVLTMDLIFLNRAGDEVFFAYKDSEYRESIKSAIWNLINEFKYITTENGKYYLNLVSEYLKTIESGQGGVISFIDDLEMEISGCGLK